MDKEKPDTQSNDDPGADIIPFPISEVQRSIDRHPAGKMGHKSIEQTLSELDDDDPEPA